MSSITLRAEDDGSEIHAEVGDTIVLRLAENPTTGFLWAYDSVNGPLDIVGDYYAKPDSGESLAGIGASTFRLFKLRVTGPETATVRLKRYRDWEGDASTEATFSITVRTSRSK